MSEREDELEDIREERLEELKEKQQEGGDQESREEAQQQAEAQKEAMLRQHLTDGARQRLNTVKMSKPQFAEKVEQQVLALAQSGRIEGRVDEDEMKQLLEQMSPDSKSFNIKRR